MVKNNSKKTSAKKQYSAAEKRSFKRGMAVQYNKEHPKFNYAVAEKHTSYNEDGSVFGTPYHGKVMLFKTKKEAENVVASINKNNKFRNDRVLAAVKKKKVNVHDSYDSCTSVAELKHIAPTRDVGYLSFKDLRQK